MFALGIDSLVRSLVRSFACLLQGEPPNRWKRRETRDPGHFLKVNERKDDYDDDDDDIHTSLSASDLHLRNREIFPNLVFQDYDARFGARSVCLSLYFSSFVYVYAREREKKKN